MNDEAGFMVFECEGDFDKKQGGWSHVKFHDRHSRPALVALAMGSMPQNLLAAQNHLQCVLACRVAKGVVGGHHLMQCKPMRDELLRL